MGKAAWMLTGAIVSCPVAAVVALAVADRFSPRELPPPAPEPARASPVTLPPPTTPAPPIIEPPAPVPDWPRIEWIDGRQAGWLIDARFRYRGRFLDCWVVCEAGEFRHVESRLAREMAKEFWREDRGPDLSPELARPTSGRIDAVLALPLEGSGCVFDVSVSRERERGNGVTFKYLESMPLPRRWFGGSVTNGPTPNDLGAIYPGQTRRLYQHIHGRPASGLDTDGRWLSRLRFRRKDESDGFGTFQFSIPLDEMNCRSSRLRRPAAWTAAWMLAGAGPVQPPLLAAVPYHEFLDAYASYVRLAVYARFLSDEEVARVRAAAAEGRRANRDSDGERELVKLIESFRSNRDGLRDREGW